MAQQRLPYVDGDDGDWGDILNQFIEKEHYNTALDDPANGGHQKITIRPGTAAAGTAPLKFTSGTLLSAPEAGAVEFQNDKLYFTETTGPTRKTIAAYDDTSGATGDTYYRDSGGDFVRLGIGAEGKVLRVTSGLPVWGDASSTFATATKTIDYTVTGTDVVILANAASTNVTITLPLASSFPGYRFFVKRIDNSANTCQIARSGSDTIDGDTSITLTVQYLSMTLVSNGSAWYII